MDVTDFFENVDKHADLEGISIDVESNEVVVQHTSTSVKTTISTEVIEEQDWEALEGVLTGKRDPEALKHLSRVVGYYSQVGNWNKSKVGELKDRQKGNYSVGA